MRTSRTLLCLSIISLAVLFMIPTRNRSARAAGSGKLLMYVGTYTTKQRSKGIYTYRFDSSTGKLTSVGLAAESTDPSFLAVHPNGRYLYAVNELDEFAGQKSGAVTAFQIDHKSGSLKMINQMATAGGGPCHVSLNKTGKYVFVANYGGGSIAVFPVRSDGGLGDATAFVQHSGTSVDKERQEKPHAHWIGSSPDDRFVLVSDLGLDEVLVYRLDAAKGSLAPNHPPFAKVDPGAGARHFAFSRNAKFGYVLNEMAATVTAFSYDAAKGVLSNLETVPTLAKDYSGPKEAAELVVHPSGKFLYASNRAGVDAITVFAIDPDKGTLKRAGQFPTKGKTPRNFAIDPSGKFLLAANQESGNIVVFRINASTGALTSTGQTVEVSAPVCITFVAAE
jgi:6-phosphogluconolactonase